MSLARCDQDVRDVCPNRTPRSGRARQRGKADTLDAEPIARETLAHSPLPRAFKRAAREQVLSQLARGCANKAVRPRLAALGDRDRRQATDAASAPLPAASAEGPGAPVRHRYNPAPTAA